MKNREKNICLFERTAHLTAVKACCLLCCLCPLLRYFHRATRGKNPQILKKQVFNYITWLGEQKQARTFFEVTINLQLSQLNVCLITLPKLFNWSQLFAFKYMLQYRGLASKACYTSMRARWKLSALQESCLRKLGNIHWYVSSPQSLSHIQNLCSLSLLVFLHGSTVCASLSSAMK